MIKVCEYCSKEYKTYKKNSKFCSRECSAQNQNKKVEKVCRLCGKSYFVHKYREHTSNYCSKTCHDSVGKTNYICKYCKKSFVFHSFSNRVFCSIKCRDLYQSNNPSTLYAEDEIKRILIKKGYELLGNYEGMNNRTLIKHIKCGKSYERCPSGIINGDKSCKYCSAHRSFNKTPKEYEEEVYKQTNGEYLILSQYKTNKEKILIKHLKCGYEWKQIPTSILQGYGCPNCRASKGEKEVANVLEKLQVCYKREFRIKECKDKKSLPFDFAIFYNEKLCCLIEYQGEQHYRIRKNSLFGKTLTDRIKKDNIKRTFCKENNINLIEIPYTISNIEQFILDKLPTKCLKRTKD